jgi:hypothetical protein
MDYLYWITRLDDIRGVTITLMVMSILSLIVWIIVYFYNKSEIVGRDENSVNTCYRSEAYYTKIGKRWSILSLVVMLITMGVVAVVPTTKQGLLIYGVKESVEYVKTHPTAKGLPEKAIKALDTYLEKEINENEHAMTNNDESNNNE